MFDKLENCSKWSTCIGAFLMALPIGLQWYWGNISTYVYSYIIKYYPDYDDINSAWLLCIYFIAWNSTIFITGMILNRVGKRKITVLGIVIFNGGLISSYFVIKSEPVLLNLTLGIMVGIGSGIIFSSGMSFMIEWSTSNVGLYTSVFLSSYNVGSILVNQVTSFYTNPTNRMPDLSRYSTRFFSHNSVVDKVPFVFLLLASGSFACQAIGLALVRVRNHINVERDYEEMSVSNEDKKKIDNENENENENKKLVQRNGDGKTNQEKRETSLFNYSPKQVLKCRYFYALFMIFILLEYPYVIIVNYYKAFGILKVDNDHFFALIASVMVVCAAVFRVLGGFVIDKIGARFTLIGSSVILGVGLAFLYFTALLGQWAYGVMAVFLASICCAQFACFVISMVLLFGSHNSSANVGLLLTAGVVLDLVAPQIVESLMHAFGWFALFLSGSFAVLIGLLLIIFCLPDY